jgi:hypothetical protein
MERIVLLLVTVAAALTPLALTGWRWLSAVATVFVGAVGFVLSVRADRRAAREEARAIRAERRADEAEHREREAHGWDREKRQQEQQELRARQRVEEWVAEQKKAHGGGFFPLALADLDIARAAQAMGLVTLKEHRGNDGSVDLAMARVD